MRPASYSAEPRIERVDIINTPVTGALTSHQLEYSMGAPLIFSIHHSLFDASQNLLIGTKQ